MSSESVQEKKKLLENITKELWDRNIKHNVVIDELESRIEVRFNGLILNQVVDAFREWFKAENVFIFGSGETIYIDVIENL